MKTSFFKLTMIASAAMLSSQSHAQSSAVPTDAPTTLALKAPAGATKPPSATAASLAANGKTAMPTASLRAVIAAGSVLLLADGIVDSAAIAQIHPPAPGFVYER